MSEEKFIHIIFFYVLVNFLLFILYKLTGKIKIIHKVISIIDNGFFALIVGYGFYRVNPLLVILAPCVLLIVYPISWGLNRELSEEEVSDLVILKSPLPLREDNRRKLKLGFAHFATFPFYYLLASWEKS